MTYSHDDRATLAARRRGERVRALGLGALLLAAGGVSLVHLAGEYREAAPWREARAEAYARDREAREAAEDLARTEADLRGDNGLNAQLKVMADAARSEAPATDPTVTPEQEQRRLAEAVAAARTARERPAPAPVSAPFRWYIRPAWPSVRESAFPEGVDRMSVRFACDIGADGVLSACQSTESPSGTGLADRLRPALNRARVEPIMVGGRAVAGKGSFSVSIDRPVRTARPSPPSGGDAPAPDATPPAEPAA